MTKPGLIEVVEMNEKIITETCDIAIIGVGPVGAALALALRGSGLKGCVLQAHPPHPNAPWRRSPPLRGEGADSLPMEGEG